MGGSPARKPRPASSTYVTGLHARRRGIPATQQASGTYTGARKSSDEDRHLHQRASLDVRRRIAIPAAQRKPAMLTISASGYKPDQVDRVAAHLHPAASAMGQQRPGDAPSAERRERVAEHDPAPVRRGEQQAPREAVLEVAREREPREHAAERGRLEQDEDELERRVAGRVVEAGHVLGCDSPPAKAVKKKSGKASDGRKSDGVVRTFFQRPPATPGNGPDPHVRSSLCPSAHPGGASETTARATRPEAERERLGVPAEDDEAADALDQVRHRVHRRQPSGTSRRRSGCAACSSTR